MEVKGQKHMQFLMQNMKNS